MHFLLFATLTGTVLAKSYLGQFPNALQARQGGDAFIPTSGGTVVNCPAPCGEVDCLQLSRGDTCCAEGCKCILLTAWTLRNTNALVTQLPGKLGANAYAAIRWLPRREFLLDQRLLLS